MSVAFRRESDDEHKEPRFELPIPPGPNYVTARGLAQIEAKVTAFETHVAGMADGPEREERRRELRYWRQRLATAQPMGDPPADEVGFGARVTFRLDGRERTVTIVGDDEADPAAGYLAFSAPLVRAMIGAAAGERVAFAGRDEAIEIVALG